MFCSKVKPEVRDACTQTEATESAACCRASKACLQQRSYKKPKPCVFYSEMLSQNRRFISFQPILNADRAELLAKAGFFYIESLKLIQYVYCLYTLDMKYACDEECCPIKEHQRINRKCPFICNKPVGNVEPVFGSDEELPYSFTLWGVFVVSDFVSMRSKYKCLKQC